jgi:serine/threonine-protein kinase PpkA
VIGISPQSVPPQIPGYAVERQLGRGGMATVYLAKQISLDRPVAIKVMVAEATQDEAMAQRFETEARVIAKLEHPNIVGIHEVGRTADGRLFYVMPYLPHGDLAQRDLSQDELAIAQVLRALLEALGYAHARGVVHRDVKPENVLFDALDRPRLADFGIALSPRRGNPRITGDGMTLGSSGYMSPEQGRGARVDGRADLYSVGVLAFELLSGEMPFHASDPLAVAIMHAQDPVPRLPAARRHWQPLIDRAMAKRPDQRFRSAAAMLRALTHIEREITRRQRGALRAWLAVPPLRNSPILQLGLGLAISLGLAWATLTWLNRAAEAPAESAIAAQNARIEQLLGEAATQLNAGRLLAPAGNNAAESYLAILALQPSHLEAGQGMAMVFETLADEVDAAIAAGDEQGARERVEQASLLADSLGDSAHREGLVRVRARAQQRLDQDIAAAAQAGDMARAESRLALMATLGLDASASGALVRQLRAWPAPGARLRDGSGPLLRFVPAEASADGRRSSAPQPFALMQAAVSLGEYRRFAEATGRPAARCRARLSPLRVIDRRTWSDPGFDQQAGDPVVCVSPEDAAAYAQWLSQRSGQRYRLPSAAERRHAAIAARAVAAYAGSSSLYEWVADCAERDAAGGGCRQQLSLNAGARGQRLAPAERAAETGRGFDDIGFRLLRELSLETLPGEA